MQNQIERSRSSGNQHNSSHSDSLAPPPSPYPATVDPSPVDSNGTTTTEIEDEPTDDAEEVQSQLSSNRNSNSHRSFSSTGADSMESPQSPEALTKLDTTAPSRADPDPDAPQSVIHAPTDYKQFRQGAKRSSPNRTRSRAGPDSPGDRSDHTVVSPSTPEPNVHPDSVKHTSPIDTALPPIKTTDKATPRAHTRQEAEEERRRRLSRRSNSLEDIAEAPDGERGTEDEESTTQKSGSNDSPSTNDGQSADRPGSRAATMGHAAEQLKEVDLEIRELKTALSECWTLCNTLAKLSQNHRERMFNYAGKGEVQEQAWRSCWRLCQKLYESREEDHASQVRPTLELCRDFCQALFEVRQRGDPVNDSVLRVSFELNNHLYNTQDRNLPVPFRERTLDFYLTLCHRLMKQRTILPAETDALLRSCWSLAEMLFSLRQNTRDSKPPDEELLGSAVQACWELCDLFREGWNQVRPDRGTPRPNQASFPREYHQYGYTTYGQPQHGVTSTPSVRSEQSRSHHSRSTASIDESSYHSVRSQAGGQTSGAPSRAGTTNNSPQGPARGGGDVTGNTLLPETPTTIFDDHQDLSPDEAPVPNILVLGPENATTRTHNRWSSAASTLSAYTDSASGSSSMLNGLGGPMSAAVTNANEGMRPTSAASSTATGSTVSGPSAVGSDPHLERLKALILRAAMNTGFRSGSGLSLPAFVRSLPATAFGATQWQVRLLDAYRRLVVTDPTLRGPDVAKRRYTAAEVGRAVQWMERSEQFGWFRDLYRFVFGFYPEEAAAGAGPAAGFQV
ncbi:hypothetical protein BDY21DRAFT_215372 [Lineolata rhizophorae]|uniref:DUF7624 domain-containing protein n=1 Tax=Lineolata rhizophorae TaxID=578093 RepID=A0A6A6P2V1_9PEZI|nr:hypothetical protein BDY21DRAFT_215372 [Lineolata rhizophorae]